MNGIPTRCRGTAQGVAPVPASTRRRHYDSLLGMSVVHVLQGDYYVTDRKDTVLTTVLGSCISACIRDPLIGYGGMNHFLLPGSRPGGGSDDGRESGALTRYGSYAMEQLINDLLSRGAARDRLEIKVFGGGNVVKFLNGVGHRNADFIEAYLANEGLRVSSSHLRGDRPRKIQYFPRTGTVRMRELGEETGAGIFEKEKSRSVRAIPSAETGTVELFD